MAKIRVIDGVHKGKHRASPHSFWTLCANELAKVFDEIIGGDPPVLLEKCYCELRSRDFDEDFITEITTGIPSALVCSGQIRPDEFLQKHLLTESSYKQPFLIINDVGTGKSTYVFHYFLIRVKEYKLDDKIEGILVNLRDLGEGDDIRFETVEQFVHQKIDLHLTKRHRNISEPDVDFGPTLFKDDFIPYGGIIRYLKGKNVSEYEAFILSKVDKFVENKAAFNRARIRRVQETGKKIFIVLDNVDQFGKRTQEKVFSLSVKLIDDLQTSIIMTCRDYTLPTAFRHSPLAAFQPRFLHLALPDSRGIIQKRIAYLFETNYLEKIFKVFGRDQIKIDAPSGHHYVFDKANLQKEFSTIVDALLVSEEIEAMLLSLSDYDMRAMLYMIRVALSSGYLFPEDRERRETVKDRDFLRAIMCGNNPYYFPDDPSTLVLNLFDDGDPLFDGNNLIRLRTLQAIQVFGEKAAVNDVLRFMQSLAYPEEKVRRVLDVLMKRDLIESPYYEGSDIVRDDIRIVKLTHSGRYYLQQLIFNPIYLQEIKSATYFESDCVKVLESYIEQGRKASTKKERIAARLEATKVFIELLKVEEDAEKTRIFGSGSPVAVTNYEKIEKATPAMLMRFEKMLAGILASLE